MAKLTLPPMKAARALSAAARRRRAMPSARDVSYFDFKRQGKWELSFWDEDFSGHWTLVGYHPDGNIVPSRFESYEVFQRRMARR
jgi:hypothetical protein